MVSNQKKIKILSKIPTSVIVTSIFILIVTILTGVLCGLFDKLNFYVTLAQLIVIIVTLYVGLVVTYLVTFISDNRNTLNQNIERIFDRIVLIISDDSFLLPMDESKVLLNQRWIRNKIGILQDIEALQKHKSSFNYITNQLDEYNEKVIEIKKNILDQKDEKEWKKYKIEFEKYAELIEDKWDAIRLSMYQ